MDIAQGTWGDMGRQQCYLVLIEYLQGPPWYVPAIFVAPSNGATQSTIDTARANSPPTRLLALSEHTKAGKHILHFDRNHRLVSIWQ